LNSYPKVCAIILNWNRSDLTLECVQHLLKIDSAENLVTILVVDNGSRELEVAKLKESGLRFTLLENQQNLGFAGGMNIGMVFAIKHQFEFIWLVNNDAFPSMGCLKQLMNRLDSQPHLGMVCPELKYPDGSDQRVGSRIDLESAEHHFLFSHEIPTELNCKFALTGAAPLIRSKVLIELGLFDEKYFAYWEDYDLCTRIANSKWWTIALDRNAKCVHLEGGSTREGTLPSTTALMLSTRNAWYYFQKQLFTRDLPRIRLRHFVVSCLTALHYQKQGHTAHANAILSGLWASIQGKYGKPRSQQTPTWFHKFLLKYGWGLSQILWKISNRLGTRSSSRAFPG
jgi:GT2 family glycosyltransferase